MEGKQKINCTVCSCTFQENETSTCSLKDIIVKPCPNCNDESTKESMCGSYRCKY